MGRVFSGERGANEWTGWRPSLCLLHCTPGTLRLQLNISALVRAQRLYIRIRTTHQQSGYVLSARGPRLVLPAPQKYVLTGLTSRSMHLPLYHWDGRRCEKYTTSASATLLPHPLSAGVASALPVAQGWPAATYPCGGPRSIVLSACLCEPLRGIHEGFLLCPVYFFCCHSVVPMATRQCFYAMPPAPTSVHFGGRASPVRPASPQDCADSGSLHAPSVWAVTPI